MRDKISKLDSRTALWLYAIYSSWRQKKIAHNKCVRMAEVEAVKERARRKEKMRRRMKHVMILAENVEV
jgi:hypothetical protein